MSIQQRIASDVYRMASNAITPDQIKSLQAHLVKSVQDGAVPSYVGVPLLNDLNQKMARIQTAGAQSQAMVQQPPIAQQVVGQAEQDQASPQGVETLPSGLPEQGMAGGGIVAFSEGDVVEDEEDDSDDKEISAMLGEFGKTDQLRRAQIEALGESGGISPLVASLGKESVSFKQEGEPGRTASHQVESIKRPGGVDDLLRLIEKKESGGRRYDKSGNVLTSPKGAMGEMQVMPQTARDPGFGIRPAREGDMDDLARVGRELYTKLYEKYKDPKLAAAAYNWGSGNVDKWLVAGGDESRLPAETRQYIKGFKEGGIASFANTGLVDDEDYYTIPNMYQGDTYARAMRKAKGIPEEETKPRYTPGKLPSDFGMRMAREDLYGIPGLQTGTPYADAMARIPKAAPAGPAGPSVADTLFADAAAKEKSRQDVMNKLSESDYARQMGNVGGFFGDIGKGLLGGIGTLGKHLVSAPGYGLSGLSESQTPTAGAGRGTMPASAYNVPAAQAAMQRPSVQQRPSENAYTAAQDEQDLLAGASDQDLSKPIRTATEAAAAAAKPEAATEEGGIRSVLDKYRQDINKQREIDTYLSLLSAGLGMMGGTSPYGMANIGHGAQQGVSTYAQLGAQRSAEERALLGAESKADYYKMLNRLRTEQKEGTEELKRMQLGINQQRVDQDRMNQLNKQAEAIESQAGKIVEQSGKLAALEALGKSSEDIAREKKRMVDDLLSQNKRYRAIQKQLMPGVEESFEGTAIRTYDPKTKSLK